MTSLDPVMLLWVVVACLASLTVFGIGAWIGWETAIESLMSFDRESFLRMADRADPRTANLTLAERSRRFRARGARRAVESRRDYRTENPG